MRRQHSQTASLRWGKTRSLAVCVAAFTLLAGSTVVPASEPAPGNGFDNVLGRDDTPLQQYRAYRRMHASTDKGKHEAWLEAWTELKDGRFTYEVVSERGSETVRGKVLRSMLQREQELVNSGNTAKGELTAANYEFTEAGRDVDGTRVVQIKPKRDDVLLVDGRAVLDDGGDLLRVEGKLAKNPSFWTSLVNIVRRYARIGGVRVPIATETVAKVKMVGTSKLQVLYDYESVNGRPVRITAARSEAPAHTAGR
ncbi:MAG TPA: hypothetical protein VFK57_24225 [Vicinamibacterales bacterium]|nr:hypothetical protein [Vicinamibacterales bacterium]